MLPRPTACESLLSQYEHEFFVLAHLFTWRRRPRRILALRFVLVGEAFERWKVLLDTRFEFAFSFVFVSLFFVTFFLTFVKFVNRVHVRFIVVSRFLVHGSFLIGVCRK